MISDAPAGPTAISKLDWISLWPGDLRELRLDVLLRQRLREHEGNEEKASTGRTATWRCLTRFRQPVSPTQGLAAQACTISLTSIDDGNYLMDFLTYNFPSISDMDFSDDNDNRLADYFIWVFPNLACSNLARTI